MTIRGKRDALYPDYVALVAVATERAAAYDSDHREGIKADVINAFYAGAEWQAKRAAAAASKPACLWRYGEYCPACAPLPVKP